MISSRKKYIGVVRVSFDVAITEGMNRNSLEDLVQSIASRIDFQSNKEAVVVEQDIDRDMEHIYTPGHLEDINYEASLEL